MAGILDDVGGGLSVFDTAPAPEKRRPTSRNSLVGGALSAGWNNLQALGGAATAAVGDVIASDALKNWGIETAIKNQQEAQAGGRPDLDVAPWEEGGASLPEWLLYQTLSQGPQLATQVAAGKVLGKLDQKGIKLTPKSLEEIGKVVPRALGGGGAKSRALADAAQTAAGKDFAQTFAGSVIAGYPMAVGSMYEQAIERGDPNAGDAAAALLMAPAYAALDGLQPAQLKGLLARGQEGKLVKRVLTGAFTDAAAEVPQEAAQTAMELSFRPDISPIEKMHTILKAAVTGGAVGAVFGGVGGLRPGVRPDAMTKDDLKKATDVLRPAAAPEPLELQSEIDRSGTVGPIPAEPQGPPAPRPFQRESDEALVKRIADIDRRMYLTAQAGTEPPQQDVILRDRLRAEVAARNLDVEQQEQPTRQGPTAPTEPVAPTPVQTGPVFGRAKPPVAPEIAPAPEFEPTTMSLPLEMPGATLPSQMGTRPPVLPEQLSPRLAAEQAFVREGERLSRENARDAAELKADQDRLTAGREFIINAATGDKPLSSKAREVIEKAEVREPAEAVNYLRNYVESGSSYPAWAERAAQKVGLLDEKGMPQSVEQLDQKIETARAAQQEAMQKLNTLPNEENKKLFERAQARFTELRNVKAVRLDADERHAHELRAKRPPTAAPGRALFRTGPGQYEVVNVADMPPTRSGPTKFQQIEKADGQAVRVRSAELYPYDEEKLSLQSPNTAAQPPGYAPDTPASEASQVAVPPSDAFPPGEFPAAPAPASNPEAEYVAPGQLARPLETASELPSNNLGFGREDEGEANTAYFQKYEAITQDFLADPQVKASTKRKARVALDALQRGTPDMVDRVNEMLADHGAATGEMLFSARGEPAPQTNFGEIVWTQGDLKLEAAPNVKSGKTEYFVYTANGNRYEVDKLTSSSGLSQFEIMAVKRAVSRELAYDLEMAKRYPEGPFTGARSNIVATPSVPTEWAQYVQSLLAQVGLENVRVFIHTPGDVKDQKDTYKYYGQYSAVASAIVPDAAMEAGVSWMGPGNKDWAFMVKPDMMTDPRNAVETLAHEVGHIVETMLFQSADPRTREAIMDAYQAWVAKTRGKDLAGVIKILRNRQAAADAARRGVGVGQSVFDEYWTSFAEWFADQTSKWATTSNKPLTLVDKFFAKVAGYMRKLASMVFGNEFEPDIAVKRYLDGLVAKKENAQPLGRVAFGKRLELPQPEGERMRAMRMASPAPGPGELNRRLQDIFKGSTMMLKAVQAAPWISTSTQVNKLHLLWSSVQHITSMFKDLFPNGVLGGYGDAHRLREAIEGRVVALLSKANIALDELEAIDPDAANDTRTLMGASFRNVDVRKTFEQQPWLKDEKNQEQLRAYVKRMNDIYNRLKGNDRHVVYDKLVSSNEIGRYMEQAVSLYNLAMADAAVPQSFKDTLVDPMEQFIAEPAAFEDTAFANQYWREQVDTILKQTKKMVADEVNRTGQVDKKTGKTIQKMTDTIQGRIAEIERQLKAMEMAPYFHIGRFGDHYVAFQLNARTDGTPDPDELDEIARRMEEAGFDYIELPTEAVKSRAYVRFESEAESVRFVELVKQLREDGLIKQGEKTIEAGLRVHDHLNDEPTWATRLQEHLNLVYETFADEMPEDQKKLFAGMRDKYRSSLRQFFLEMTPDTSLLKVNLRRERIPGFSKDLQRSYAFRTHVGARAIANMYAAPKLSAAMSGIRDAINDARVVGRKQGTETADHKKRTMMQNIFTEFVRRESDRPTVTKNTWVDKLRAINHAWFLGLSPAYVIVNLTQLGVTLWPELAKKHGFVRSAKAMAKITPMAVKIMAATLAEAKKTGMKRMWDGTITSEALKRAGIGGADAKFILRTANSGLFDMGSQSRELGRIIDNREDNRLELGLRIASSLGYYSEMASRLVAGLAARELHGDGPGLDAYVADTVNEAMFNYSNYNTARATGRLGVAGPTTPIMAAFMQYTMQLIEKLYREVNTAFIDSAKSPADKREARRFVGAHLAAVTATAGTLGLPMASIFAAVINKMVDVLGDDDEPFDAKIAYHHFLNTTFGTEIGNMLARGVPQLAGFDIQQRAGEADILPFSRFLTDRRSWKDAGKDLAFDTLGSPASMVLNFLSGADKIANGEFLEGMIEGAPTALKAPAKAFKLYSYGYVDKSYNKQPVDPGAMDYFYQLIGFNPAQNALVQEIAQNDQAITGQMQRKSQLLRKELVKAIENNTDDVRELMAEAQEWDARNPDYPVLRTLAGTLSRRAKARAMSVITDAPLGTTRRAAERYNFLGELN